MKANEKTLGGWRNSYFALMTGDRLRPGLRALDHRPSGSNSEINRPRKLAAEKIPAQTSKDSEGFSEETEDGKSDVARKNR